MLQHDGRPLSTGFAPSDARDFQVGTGLSQFDEFVSSLLLQLRLRMFVQRIAGLLAGRHLRGRVVRALAITPRGGVAHDFLQLSNFSAHLRVEWTARDVHPWDSDLPPGARAERFVDQSLTDTNAAIHRLFRMLPEVEVIEIRVLDPNSGAPIIAGTITRDEALTVSSPSPRMKLKKLGVDYRLRSGQFEPLT